MVEQCSKTNTYYLKTNSSKKVFFLNFSVKKLFIIFQTTYEVNNLNKPIFEFSKIKEYVYKIL